MKGKVIKKTMMIPFLVMGLIIAGLSIYMFINPDEREYVSTEAVVERIEKEFDTMTNAYEDVIYISYEAEGVVYTDIEYPISTKAKVGDRLPILYDKEDTSFYQAPGFEQAPVIVLMVSFVLLTCALFIFLKGE